MGPSFIADIRGYCIISWRTLLSAAYAAYKQIHEMPKKKKMFIFQFMILHMELRFVDLFPFFQRLNEKLKLENVKKSLGYSQENQ